MIHTYEQQKKLENIKYKELKPLINNNKLSKQADKQFKTKISSDFFSLINLNNKNDPIALQVLPLEEELKIKPNFLKDPVGDTEAIKTPGLIHKYKNRVLLITTPNCAIHCRYCFRRNFDYKNNISIDKNFQRAIQYLQKNINIKEVILSGGDPLTLSNDKLFKICDQLEQIKHLKTIRFHSRYPIVNNERIDQDFLKYFKCYKKKCVFVSHINHANELTPQSKEIFKKLKNTGFILLNQSVLLNGINNDANVLINLSHQLFDQGILPYYLHILDKVQGASHFKTTTSENIIIYKKLLTNLPGYLVPKLVQEIKGQLNKISFC